MANKSFLCDEINYNISYKLLNTSQNESILFLHGWGANKELMEQAFKNSFKNFTHIYLDLPGFGNSSIQKPLNSHEVKNIVEKFLVEIDKKPNFIIGHSFGGKIATLLNPQTLVLLSSAGIILPKRFSVRAKIAIFKFLKSIGLGRFYKLFATKDVEGMSKTMYEMAKIAINEDFSEYFKNCTSKAFLFWGKQDSATPLIAGEKIHSLIKKSQLFIYEGDHFFFLKQAEKIEKDIFTCKEENA
ncbi:MAG: alpha/beta fold hydrolase [Campylobacteraceae bacterium]